MLLGSRQLWIAHRKCKLKEITFDSTIQLRVKDHNWFTNVARCCSISTLKISWFPTCQSSMDWVGGLANWNWGNESRIHPIYHNSISSSTATNDHWLVERTSSLCTEISRVWPRVGDCIELCCVSGRTPLRLVRFMTGRYWAATASPCRLRWPLLLPGTRGGAPDTLSSYLINTSSLITTFLQLRETVYEVYHKL